LAVAPGEERAPAPAFRAQAHLMTIVADKDNFAACDHTRGFAFIRLTNGALRDPGYARYYFLDGTSLHLLTQLHVTPVHAACVAWNGKGVLLCGPSGAGKSCLAYACVRGGFTYVSDNDSWLVRQARQACVAGDPRRMRFRPSAAELFPELRGGTPFVSPAGKRTIELPRPGMEGLRTSFHASVAGLAFLKRDGAAGVKAVAGGRVIEELTATIPVYQPDVSAAHRASLERLAKLPAFEVGYDGLAEGVERMRELADSV
jgi:hypothetical protein